MSAWFGWRPGAFQGWYSTTTTVITGYDVQCWTTKAWTSNSWLAACWGLPAIPLSLPGRGISAKLPTWMANTSGSRFRR